eukprot:CAMPEP_0117480556 /NCGR_PEP_ID=MMETSP0784-20121206/12450_1 /TAXON_ID=39447 /ORGANISM="" /LENGTH=1084 /DNA_ID=CAMNT_0005274995 /DNA_START=8 /DNA_END=3259 /DNA_ORIENTATION=-
MASSSDDDDLDEDASYGYDTSGSTTYESCSDECSEPRGIAAWALRAARCVPTLCGHPLDVCGSESEPDDFDPDELRAAIAERDALNAQIRARQRKLSDSAESAQRRGALEMKWSDDVERKWRDECLPRNIALGAKTLMLVGGMSIAMKACIWTWPGVLLDLREARSCRWKTSAGPWVDRHLVSGMVELVFLLGSMPFLFCCARRPHRMLYYTLLVSYFVYVILFLLPPFMPSCEDRLGMMECTNAEGFMGNGESRDCNLQGYTLMQFLMAWILLTPTTIPQYKLMHITWAWIFLLYVGAAVTMRYTNSAHKSHSRLEVFGCVAFLCAVNLIAISRKWYTEKGQRKKFITALQEIESSRRIFEILQYMVPEFVIVRMIRQPGATIAEQLDRVSVLFIEFEAFDQTARTLPPGELLRYLNKYFTKIDKTCLDHHVLKIETVGPEYVCAVGVTPDDREEDSTMGHRDILGRLISVAYSVLDLPTGNDDEDKVVFRMGIHTGPVVAGVIGHKLPRYRLFGDTINTAARMMQKGVPGEVQFGEETKTELPEWAVARCRGPIEMKGKGLVTAYIFDRSASGSALSMGHTATMSSGRSLRSVGSRSRRSSSLRAAMNTPRVSGLLHMLTSDMTHSFPRKHAGKFEEVLKEFGDRHDTTIGASCSLRPGSVNFTEDMEISFRRWFHRNKICKKIFMRLDRQALFLAGITAIEVMYIFLRARRNSFNNLHSFLWYRAACIFIVVGWRLFANCSNIAFDAQRLVQWFMLVSCCIVAVFMYVSYAHINSLEDNIKHENICELMVLPIYTLVTTAHPFFYHHALFFIALALFLMCCQRWDIYGHNSSIYFSKIGAVFFVINAMLHTYESFDRERMLRDWFGARFAADMTQQRVESILRTLMPPMVVEELRASPTLETLPSHKYFRATIAQSDLCGFTKLASEREASEVVGFIGELFGLFDDLTDKHKVYKVETIGDAYIAGQAEHPLTYRNSPLSVVLFGLDMVNATREWSRSKGESVACRVGVHFGECIGGIVGTDMQRYHLFGAFMQTLELLESTAPEANVQVSRACKDAVEIQLREDAVLSGILFQMRAESRL